MIVRTAMVVDMGNGKDEYVDSKRTVKGERG